MIEMVMLQGWRALGAWHFALGTTLQLEDGSTTSGPGMAWTRQVVTDDNLPDLLEYVAEELFAWAPVLRENPPV